MDFSKVHELAMVTQRTLQCFYSLKNRQSEKMRPKAQRPNTNAKACHTNNITLSHHLLTLSILHEARSWAAPSIEVSCWCPFVECPPGLTWTQMWTRLTCVKLSSSRVVKVVLVAQFSTTCTVSSVHVNGDSLQAILSGMPNRVSTWLSGHGGLWVVLSGTQGLLNSFPATLLAFSNVVSGCIRSLPECQSIRQSNRVDWLVSFSKMTNIH